MKNHGMKFIDAIHWVNMSLCLISLISVSSIYARESDPYMAAQIELEDSLPQLHEYMLGMMKQGLIKVNDSKALASQSCLDVAHNVMLEFRHLTYQKIENWADHAEGLERAPGRGDLSDLEYIKQSYIGFSPFNIAFARTLNFGGIYIGSDKLGHFTSWGLRYLNVYRNKIKAGATVKEAMKAAIEMGHQSEHSILGKWTTRIGSYGDLEANFQGMLFTLNLCERSDALHLQQSPEGKWELAGELNMMEYINLDWDEIYNPSVIAKGFFKRKAADKLRLNCNLLTDEEIQSRYRELSLDYQPSFNKLYLAKLDKKKFGHEIQDDFSLTTVCQEQDL